jgi:dTDP-glucose pyrophosphorylase
MIDATSIIMRCDEPAFNAVKIIDVSDGKIALIVDEDEVLIGSATDGDIRRGLLKGSTLNSPISEFMHCKPAVLPVSSTRGQILEMMLRLDIKQIPLVVDNGKIVGLTTLALVQGMSFSNRSNPGVIMAGGKGKRLLPLTKDIPKSMVEIGGHPILERIIQRFQAQGFGHFYIAINHLGNIIEDYFSNGRQLGCKIEYLRENQELGTAGALSLLDLSGDFIVINGDILSSIDFGEVLDTHLEAENVATICARTHQTKVPFGVLCVNGDGLVENIVEKPIYEDLISAGIYVLKPAALAYIPKNTFTDMPDLLLNLVQAGHKVGVYNLHEDWVDIGRHDDLERARNVFVEKS